MWLKLILLTWFCWLPFISTAQNGYIKGIVWVTGLSWKQVKEKAREENKYIFVDAYATWCQPCREMDRNIYTNDSVGAFFNNKFISIKVQMDKTKNDAEDVRSWYEDAKMLEQSYRVLAFPTYVFLSPQGKIVHKESGYKDVKSFLSIAATAIEPGRYYVDKYEEYDQLTVNYRQGKKDYSRMLYMIETARILGDVNFSKVLVKDYCSYLETLKDNQLYTKENIDFLGNNVTIKKDSWLFTLFYKKGKKVDRSVKMRGYSKVVIDDVIQREIVTPFLGLKIGPIPIGGKPDTTEADWEGLHEKIKEYYSKEYADRSLITAKYIWYAQKFNYKALYTVFFEKLNRYGFDNVSLGSSTSYAAVNSKCWSIFLSIDDRKVIVSAVKWMKRVIRKVPDNYMYIDTYANLLYKSGKKTSAIKWEEIALLLAQKKQSKRNVKIYEDTLDKMKSGNPTWVKKITVSSNRL